MALAVIKKPDNFSGAIDSLAGAFQGMNAGEARLEEKRKFDETIGLEKEKFSESKVQWDEDMEYRFQALDDLNMNQRLDREQQKKFEYMRDHREREMQKSGQDFQEYFTKTVEQPFQAGQNEQDRTVQKRGQDLNYRASTYSTFETARAAGSQLAEQRRQHQTERGAPVQFARNVLGPEDYKTLPPDQQELKVVKYMEQKLGADRMYGATNVIQATPRELAEARAEALDILPNRAEYEQAYIDEEVNLIREQTMARNGVVTGKRTGKPFLSTIPGDETWNSVGFGMPPRDPLSMAPADFDAERRMVQQLTDVQLRIASEGWGDDREALVAETFPTYMAEYYNNMKIQDPSIETYYQTLYNNIMYPKASESFDESIPE